MAASSSTERTDRSGDRTLSALSRYDLVLAVIPAAFLLAGIGSQVVSAPPRSFLVGAALVGALALIDALFVNPPRAGPRR